MRISKTLLFVGLLAIALATDCGPGSVPCPSGTCHFPSYIEGCHVYQSSESCYQCEYSKNMFYVDYVKSGNICKYSPPSDVSDCCLSFSLSGECETCANGLSLQDGVCKDIKIPGCLQKSKAGNCLNCALEYELFGGLCFKKIVGCEGYASTGECTKCNGKFDLQHGLCIPDFVVDSGCHAPFILSESG